VTETAQHVNQCQDPAAVECWQEGLEKLRSTLEDNDTPNDVIEYIVTALRAWQRDEQVPHADYLSEQFEEATLQQQELGWSAFVEGRLGRNWETALSDHYKKTKSKKNGKRWMTAVIRKLWEIAWDMWNQRNDIVHAVEEARTRSQLEEDIRKEFKLGTRGLNKLVQRMFRAGVLAILRKQTVYQKGWLRWVRTNRELRKKKDTGIRRQRAVMYTFFRHGTG
jgi:hypothetical protein